MLEGMFWNFTEIRGYRGSKGQGKPCNTRRRGTCVAAQCSRKATAKRSKGREAATSDNLAAVARVEEERN
jgi:hypothetical protein